jgi:hypothetical protein
MSQQSIHTVNYESIIDKTKKSMVSSYNKNKLYTRFALGQEESEDVIEHNSIMYDILKNANCHTIDLVNALQQPSFKKTKYGIKDGAIVIEDNSDQLYKIWLSKGNMGTIEDFFDSITKNTIDNLTIWEDVEW